MKFGLVVCACSKLFVHVYTLKTKPKSYNCELHQHNIDYILSRGPQVNKKS